MLPRICPQSKMDQIEAKYNQQLQSKEDELRTHLQDSKSLKKELEALKVCGV